MEQYFAQKGDFTEDNKLQMAWGFLSDDAAACQLRKSRHTSGLKHALILQFEEMDERKEYIESSAKTETSKEVFYEHDGKEEFNGTSLLMASEAVAMNTMSHVLTEEDRSADIVSFAVANIRGLQSAHNLFDKMLQTEDVIHLAHKTKKMHKSWRFKFKIKKLWQKLFLHRVKDRRATLKSEASVWFYHVWEKAVVVVNNKTCVELKSNTQLVFDKLLTRRTRVTNSFDVEQHMGREIWNIMVSAYADIYYGSYVLEFDDMIPASLPSQAKESSVQVLGLLSLVNGRKLKFGLPCYAYSTSGFHFEDLSLSNFANQNFRALRIIVQVFLKLKSSQNKRSSKVLKSWRFKYKHHDFVMLTKMLQEGLIHIGSYLLALNIKLKTTILHKGLADRVVNVSIGRLQLMKYQELSPCFQGVPVNLLPYLADETCKSIAESALAVLLTIMATDDRSLQLYIFESHGCFFVGAPNLFSTITTSQETVTAPMEEEEQIVAIVIHLYHSQCGDQYVFTFTDLIAFSWLERKLLVSFLEKIDGEKTTKEKDDKMLTIILRRTITLMEKLVSDKMIGLSISLLTVFEKVLRMLACWIGNQNEDYFKKQIAIFPNYTWAAKDKMKMQSLKGQLRNTRFVGQTIVASDLFDENGDILKKEDQCINKSQGWQVSDYTAETIDQNWLFLKPMLFKEPLGLVDTYRLQQSEMNLSFPQGQKSCKSVEEFEGIGVFLFYVGCEDMSSLLVGKHGNIFQYVRSFTEKVKATNWLLLMILKRKVYVFFRAKRRYCWMEYHRSKSVPGLANKNKVDDANGNMESKVPSGNPDPNLVSSLGWNVQTVETAEELFKKIFMQDNLVFDVIIAYYDQDDHPRNALKILYQMLRSLHDDFSIGTSIDNSEVKSLMASTGLSSCMDTLARLENILRQFEKEAEDPDRLPSVKSASFGVEPMDEMVIPKLQQYTGKKSVNINNETLEFGAADKVQERKTNKEFNPLCNWTKQLSDKIARVQVSNHLSSSPWIFVSGKFGWSTNMERLRNAQAIRDTLSLEILGDGRIEKLLVMATNIVGRSNMWVIAARDMTEMPMGVFQKFVSRQLNVIQEESEEISWIADDKAAKVSISKGNGKVLDNMAATSAKYELERSFYTQEQYNLDFETLVISHFYNEKSSGTNTELPTVQGSISLWSSITTQGQYQKQWKKEYAKDWMFKFKAATEKQEFMTFWRLTFKVMVLLKFQRLNNKSHWQQTITMELEGKLRLKRGEYCYDPHVYNSNKKNLNGFMRLRWLQSSFRVGNR